MGSWCVVIIHREIIIIYYYLRIFTEDKHFSIIHTVINMCPPYYIHTYIHKIQLDETRVQEDVKMT